MYPCYRERALVLMVRGERDNYTFSFPSRLLLSPLPRHFGTIFSSPFFFFSFFCLVFRWPYALSRSGSLFLGKNLHDLAEKKDGKMCYHNEIILRFIFQIMWSYKHFSSRTFLPFSFSSTHARKNLFILPKAGKIRN